MSGGNEFIHHLSQQIVSLKAFRLRKEEITERIKEFEWKIHFFDEEIREKKNETFKQTNELKQELVQKKEECKKLRKLLVEKKTQSQFYEK